MPKWEHQLESNVSERRGPGAYQKKLDTIGRMRESYSKKGFGALASKAERGLQEKIFSVVNPNEMVRNSSDIRLITT